MEINPSGEKIQSDYPLSSFDPCGNYPTTAYHQVVYSCSIYPIEPYQQLFPFQGGGSNIKFYLNRIYQIEIIEGTDYAYLGKVAYQDSFGIFHPEEYFGSYLTGISGGELSGTGDYTLSSGTLRRENPSLYYIHFNNYDQTEVNVTVKITDLDSSITTYWYTTIVNPELVLANQQLNNDTLLHYYSKDVSIKLNNTKFPCLHSGSGGCPPDNVTFNIEITQGQQYGIIKNTETGETNISFTGLSWEEIGSTLYTYYANGIQPDSAAIVKIRHSSSDAEIIPMEFEFTVKRNTIPPPSEGGAIYIQLDKKEAKPSDTVDIYLKWINATGDTLEFTPIQRFQIELAEGSEYGRLLDVESGLEGDYFNDAGRELKMIIEDNIQKELAKITIVAQCDLLIWGGRMPINGLEKHKEAGEEPLERSKGKKVIAPESIIIGDHLIGVEEVIINKSPIIVEIVPEVISAGDTARIKIKKRLEDGSTIDFPAGQQFEIGILEGCLLGKLSKEGIDTNYLYGITQPIYFIADSSADSGKIKIRVGLIDSTIVNKSKRLNKKLTEEGEYCFNNHFESILYKDAEIKVEMKYEILLGETKYFGVKRKTETGELKIEEIKTNYGEEPEFPADADGWEWLKTDVWGDNPIEIIGTKSGVYWEKKWFRSSDNSNQPLSDGMIRLIGRYWEEGKEDSFKVKLKTTTNAEIKLKIIKPNKLGTKYNSSKDVFNNTISIDSICIKYGGEYGIPPQFIKGQIENEAPGFFPSYRYEPLSTELNNRNNNGEIISKKWKNSPFLVTANSMGTGDPVPTHYNLEYIPYFKTPTKVWDILKKHSQIEDNIPTGKTLYCINENGKLNFEKFGYKTAQKVYNIILRHFQGTKENPTSENYVAARDSTIKYFKYYWYGGLENIYAQTRIFASYGLLQTMYETALQRGFENNPTNIPEKLNINDISWPLTIKHLIKLLKEVLDLEFNNDNWAIGYENIFKSMAKRWNPWMTDYDLDALNNSKKYLPTNKN